MGWENSCINGGWGGGVDGGTVEKRGHPIKLVTISNSHQIQNDSSCHLDFGHSIFIFAS